MRAKANIYKGRVARGAFPFATLQRRALQSTASKEQGKAALAKAALNESFITGTGGEYMDQLFEMWKTDPSSVHASWRAFFDNIEEGAGAGDANTLPPSLHGGGAALMEQAMSPNAIAARDHMKVLLLVRA